MCIKKIEHSENKIIALSGLFGNEVGHGLHKYTVQQCAVIRSKV